MHLKEIDFIDSYKRRGSGKNALKKIAHVMPIKLDERLAKLISYVTFDGHVSDDFRQFLLSSKDEELLNDFSGAVKIFGLVPRLEENKSGWGSSHKCRVLNSSFTRVLSLAGAPRGKKVSKKFSVPQWIMNDVDCAREYLKVAFDCEGSVWNDKFGPRIRIKMHKSEKLLSNGIEFMNSLKKMLLNFGVESTNIWTIKGNDESNPKTVGICFGIKRRSFNDFKSNINFRIKIKRERLEGYTRSPRYGTRV